MQKAVDKYYFLNLTFKILQPTDNALSLTDAVINEARVYVNNQDVDLNLLTAIPAEFALHQNYPNPFNPITLIQYQLPQKSNVSLKVYNLFGQEIRTLVNEERDVGHHEICAYSS